MLKLVTSNKVQKDLTGYIVHPEIEMGMNKIWKWMEKQAQSKEEVAIFSFNPIVFRIGLLLKLQGEKVTFFYKGSKEEEVIVDSEGFYINPPYYFMDLMDKVQDEIREIRRQRKYDE